MEDFSGSTMIALLPVQTDWCKIDLPHLTLVYSGEVKDLQPTDFNALAKDACTIAMLSPPITVGVTGVEVFGDQDKVDVLRCRTTPELLAMRKLVERWDKSEFSFNPHTTIGPIGSSGSIVVPQSLTFNRIMVGWGEESLAFWLRR